MSSKPLSREPLSREPNVVPYADAEALVLEPLRAVGLDDRVLGGCNLELYTTTTGLAVHDDVRCSHLVEHGIGARARVVVSLLDAARRACECCRPQILWARAHFGGWSLLRLHQDAAELSRRLVLLELVPARALSGGMRLELEEMLGLASGRPGEAFREAEARCERRLRALARVDTSEELSLWGRRFTLVAQQAEPPVRAGACNTEQLLRWWREYGSCQPVRWAPRGALAGLVAAWDEALAAPATSSSLVAITPGARNTNDRAQRMATDALGRWFGAGVRFRVLPDDALELLGTLSSVVGAGMVAHPCANPLAAEVAASLYQQLRDVEACMRTAVATVADTSEAAA